MSASSAGSGAGFGLGSTRWSMVAAAITLLLACRVDRAPERPAASVPSLEVVEPPPGTALLDPVLERVVADRGVTYASRGVSLRCRWRSSVDPRRGAGTTDDTVVVLLSQ